MFRILDYFNAEPRGAWNFFVADKGTRYGRRY
jgi:hypothetical protein